MGDNDSNRNCARCSAQLIRVTSDLCQCDKCAHEGYRPPLISLNRNLNSDDKHSWSSVVSNRDGIVGKSNSGTLYCTSTGSGDQVTEAYLVDEAPAISGSFDGINKISLTQDSSRDSNRCADFNKKAIAASPSAANIRNVSSSRHFHNTFVPSIDFIPDISVTRRLWNQVSALQRDSDIDVNFNTSEYLDDSDLTACNNGSVNSACKKLVKNSYALEDRLFDVSVKEVEMKSVTKKFTESSFCSVDANVQMVVLVDGGVIWLCDDRDADVFLLQQSKRGNDVSMRNADTNLLRDTSANKDSRSSSGDEVSLTRAAAMARNAAKRRKTGAAESASEFTKPPAACGDDETQERYSILTQERMRATRRHLCVSIVLGLVLFLLIIVLLVSSIDIRTSIGQFVRRVGLSVDWKLRHVGSSPPV